MFATPLLISKSVWDSLSNSEKDAFEAAARVSETYFTSTQVEAEAKFIKVFTAAGAKYRKFTHDEYLAWLQLAQQTAWKQYTTISPTAQNMLMEVLEVVMFSIGVR